MHLRKHGVSVAIGLLSGCLFWSGVSIRARAQDTSGYGDSGEGIPPPQPVAPDQGQPRPVAAVPQQFDTALSPYGQWIYVQPYGWSWQPDENAVGPDFQPYLTGGSWVDTDDGWSFQTDWPWGDVTFHYGRWYVDPTYGWLWLPGFDWAPAWVDWRFGGGYCGWAPLGPAGYVWRGGGGSAWHFVDARHFGEGRVSNFVVRQPDQVRRAYASTARVQNPMQAQGVRWNAGPRAAQLASAGAPVQHVQHARPQAMRLSSTATVVPKATGHPQQRTATLSPTPARSGERPTHAQAEGTPAPQPRPSPNAAPRTPNEVPRPPAPAQHAERPTPTRPQTTAPERPPAPPEVARPETPRPPPAQGRPPPAQHGGRPAPAARNPAPPSHSAPSPAQHKGEEHR